ncbi:MAG: hypothetical protein JWP36_2928 [Paucimonas sp.]|nr:hypothetical protein [Paucimonas sp.]
MFDKKAPSPEPRNRQSLIAGLSPTKKKKESKTEKSGNAQQSPVLSSRRGARGSVSFNPDIMIGLDAPATDLAQLPASPHSPREAHSPRSPRAPGYTVLSPRAAGSPRSARRASRSPDPRTDASHDTLSPRSTVKRSRSHERNSSAIESYGQRAVRSYTIAKSASKRPRSEYGMRSPQAAGDEPGHQPLSPPRAASPNYGYDVNQTWTTTSTSKSTAVTTEAPPPRPQSPQRPSSQLASRQRSASMSVAMPVTSSALLGLHAPGSPVTGDGPNRAPTLSPPRKSPASGNSPLSGQKRKAATQDFDARLAKSPKQEAGDSPNTRRPGREQEAVTVSFEVDEQPSSPKPLSPRASRAGSKLEKRRRSGSLERDHHVIRRARTIHCPAAAKAWIAEDRFAMLDTSMQAALAALSSVMYLYDSGRAKYGANWQFKNETPPLRAGAQKGVLTERTVLTLLPGVTRETFERRVNGGNLDLYMDAVLQADELAISARQDQADNALLFAFEKLRLSVEAACSGKTPEQIVAVWTALRATLRTDVQQKLIADFFPTREAREGVLAFLTGFRSILLKIHEQTLEADKPELSVTTLAGNFYALIPTILGLKPDDFYTGWLTQLKGRLPTKEELGPFSVQKGEQVRDVVKALLAEGGLEALFGPHL